MENIFSFYPIETEDKNIITHLATAFQDNRRMKVLLGKGRADFYKKITHVISYCYFMVKKIGGLFISQDQNTYLLYYRKSKFYFSPKDCFHYLFLAVGIIGIMRLKKVYTREQTVKSIREQEIKRRCDQDYLYVWFMAQKKECQKIKGLLEAKSFILEKAKTLHLPIYIETTEERLVGFYEKFGFVFYHCFEEEEKGLKLWFGRYECGMN